MNEVLPVDYLARHGEIAWSLRASIRDWPTCRWPNGGSVMPAVSGSGWVHWVTNMTPPSRWFGCGTIRVTWTC